MSVLDVLPVVNTVDVGLDRTIAILSSDFGNEVSFESLDEVALILKAARTER